METNCDHRKCVSRIFMRCHQDQNMKNWKIIIIGDKKKCGFKWITCMFLISSLRIFFLNDMEEQIYIHIDSPSSTRGMRYFNISSFRYCTLLIAE